MFVRSTLGTISCYGLVVDTGGMSCVVTSEWDMLAVVNMVIWLIRFGVNCLVTIRYTALEVQQNL